MGLMDRLKGELVDVIEWIEQDDQTIAHRFERYGNEIKNGAKLVVREGQVAVLVDEGKLADVFEPGTYTLTTENIPILSTLKGWKHGFKSPFKAEVYFIGRRIVTGFGWGTPGPFRLRDPEFGILEMTARGHFSFKVMDAPLFLRNVVGTDGEITKDEIKDRLRKAFVTQAIDAIAESGKSFYEMASHFDELSERLKSVLSPVFFGQYGIAVEDASVQSIDLTETSAKKVELRDDVMFNDQRIDMYERRARADATVELARNQGAGGTAAQGMGIGAGIAMAGQMAAAFGGQAAPPQQPQGPAGQAVPPPPPVATIHLIMNGRQTGPMDVSQVSAYIAQGLVTRETMAWMQGMPAWASAGTIPALAHLFSGAVPPPPPPPVPPQA